ncbi:stage II sporulation protein M [Chloroflexota bacterium]
MSYKRWLIITAFLFGVGLVVGLATPATTANVLSEDIVSLLAPFPKSSALVVIFIKNVLALIISFALSPFFCLMPVLALTVNGWLIGLVSTMVIQEKSFGYLLAGLLPHGVFELPAFIMGEAVALSFGTAVILAILIKERRNLLLPNLRQNSRYFTVALILLLPAAIVETYVTPLFLD